MAAVIRGSPLSPVTRESTGQCDRVSHQPKGATGAASTACAVGATSGVIATAIATRAMNRTRDGDRIRFQVQGTAAPATRTT